jgi:hypothetical protein
MNGGFRKIIISVHQHKDLPLGMSDVFFCVIKYSHILSRQGAGGGVCETLFGERGYGRISGGARVLERAVDNRKASPRHGAR